MEIGTGYFAKAKEYADAGYALVSIAKKRPWFLPDTLNLTDYFLLSPTTEILALKDNPDVYTQKYKEDILEKLSRVRVLIDLDNIAAREHKDKLVLMCYESPEKFCHRHIVAKWLGEFQNGGIKEVENKKDTLTGLDLLP